MKRFLNATVIIFLVASLDAFSQDPAATIIISSGEILAGNGTNFRQLKIGSAINKGELLKIGPAGYVALLTLSGNTIEVIGSTISSAPIDSLVSLNNRPRSLVKKYADFVASKMTAEQMEQNRKKYASVTGAVERDVGVVAYLNKTSMLYEPLAIIRWDPQTGNAPYHITVEDNFGNQLLSRESQESFIKINFTNGSLEKADVVVVSIRDAEGLSNAYSIQRTSNDTDPEFAKNIAELKSSLDDNSAFENLILAEYYEQNNLLLDASTCYEKAMILEPGVDYFKDAFNQFLMRNNFGEYVDPSN